MAQDPRKLRKLLEILTQFGVTSYETDGIKIEIVNPATLAHKMYDGAVSVANSGFSMDNYDKGPIVSSEENENIHTSPEDQQSYSDEEMLYWSANS
ncbi:hypothetical protein CMI37_17075 [Candidatus Pacearchaeota archaeon]|nr:hypothetical protein [Candidatus Pacearchaeota archaeon]